MRSERATEAEADAGHGAPRGAIRLAFDRRFGAIFWGKLLSGLGIWVHSIVAAVVVYAATGSALWVGLLSIVQFGPQILLTPLSGTLADRGNLARQILFGRVLCGLGSGTAAAFYFLREDFGGQQDALVILAASFITGLGFVVGGPAQQSVIPLLIRPGELPTAMVLNALPMTVARVAGPAGGAFIAAQYSPTVAFAFATATHVAFIGLALLAALPEGIERAAGTDFRLRAALSYVRSDRTMLLLLLAVAAVGFGSEPSITLAPTIADEFGGRTELVGQLSASFGLGAFVGFLAYQILRRVVRQPQLLRLGLALMVLGTALVAFAPTPSTAMGAFACAGVGFMLASTAGATLVQQRVPSEMRGRVMALWGVGFVGSRPLASAMEGYLADTASAAAALLATAAVVLVVLVLFQPRRLDFPGEARAR